MNAVFFFGFFLIAGFTLALTFLCVGSFLKTLQSSSVGHICW